MTAPDTTKAPEADERWKTVCAHADTSTDPIPSMLRDAGERLDRDPPDVLGAKVCLHGARLAVSSEALSLPVLGEGAREAVEDAVLSACRQYAATARTYTGERKAIHTGYILKEASDAILAALQPDTRP